MDARQQPPDPAPSPRLWVATLDSQRWESPRQAHFRAAQSEPAHVHSHKCGHLCASPMSGLCVARVESSGAAGIRRAAYPAAVTADNAALNPWARAGRGWLNHWALAVPEVVWAPEPHDEREGRCHDCGRLGPVIGDLCGPCNDKLIERIAQEDPAVTAASMDALVYSLRPRRIVASTTAGEGVSARDTAVFPLPEDLTRPERVVAEYLAERTTQRLQDGWSLEYALRRAAFGRDMVRRGLAAEGIFYDRKTVARALNGLVQRGVLRLAGQLDDWSDPRADGTVEPVLKSGAYLYTLTIDLYELGAFASAWLLYAIDAALGGMTLTTRHVKAWLRGLISHAHEGNRSMGGYILARRCIDAGLTEGEAVLLMAAYQKAVPVGSRPYTRREAMATLRSAYRRNA